MGLESSDLEIDPISPCAEPVERVPAREIFAGWLRAEFPREPLLHRVADFFDGLCGEIGWDASAFEAQKDEFVVRLHEFTVFLEKKIEQTERVLRGSEGYQQFSENWQDNVKKACFYSFFVHFGEQRRGETEKHGSFAGQPRPYVYHVAEAAFDCLIRQMRYFREPALLATVLHDSRENFHKGLFKGCERSSALILTRFREMEDELHPGVSEILDIVTKTSNERSEAMVAMFFSMINKETDPERRFALQDALMVKLADRLHNIKTFATQGKSAEAVRDETIFVYLRLAYAYGMVNVVDFLHDYIKSPSVDEREAKVAARSAHTVEDSSGQQVSALDSAREAMMLLFEMKLELHGFPACTRGRDYILELRDCGFRLESLEQTREESRRGESHIGLQSYIIFHPVGENLPLAQAARSVFCSLFPSSEVVREESPELKTSLGRVVLAHGDAGASAVFGKGAWCVFDSDRDAIRAINGVHAEAVFFRDHALKQRILTYLADFAPTIQHLYQCFETLKMIGENDPQFLKSYRELVSTLSFFLFAPQNKLLNVCLESALGLARCPTTVPKGFTPEQAALYSNPWLIGRRFFTVCSEYILRITPEGAPFDPILAGQQMELMRHALAKIRDDMLAMDEDPSKAPQRVI